MPAKITSTARLRVALDAASPRGPLAAELLAAAAAIPVADALARLADAPCDLAPSLDPGSAQRLVRLLALFGLRVRAEPADAPRQRPVLRFDMALQWARPDGATPALDDLARRLDRTPAAVAAAMASPAGLVLRDLDRAGIGLCRRALAGLPGLRLVVSDPEAALHDLLPAGTPASRIEAVALLRHLRRLGVPGCPLTGAVGAAIDRRLVDHLARRFPAAGVVAINRDFQRFDLLLVGTGRLSAAEIDGFLRTRRDVAHVRPQAIGPATPLRIECALGRADALAFQSDYAAIGLDTRLRLVWPDAARVA